MALQTQRHKFHYFHFPREANLDWRFRVPTWDFPGGTVVKNLPANAGDMSSSFGPESLTCCGATKPVRHNSWVRMPQLLSPHA